MKKRFLILCLLQGCAEKHHSKVNSSVSPEAGWVPLATETDGAVTYADFSTMEVTPAMRRIWELVDYKKPGPNGMRSGKSLVEFDCEKARSRGLQFCFYMEPMGQGNPKGCVSTPTDWVYVLPGYSGEPELKKVCGVVGGRPSGQ